jgi:hypothetical protein
MIVCALQYYSTGTDALWHARCEVALYRPAFLHKFVYVNMWGKCDTSFHTYILYNNTGYTHIHIYYIYLSELYLKYKYTQAHLTVAATATQQATRTL